MCSSTTISTNASTNTAMYVDAQDGSISQSQRHCAQVTRRHAARLEATCNRRARPPPGPRTSNSTCTAMRGALCRSRYQDHPLEIVRTLANTCGRVCNTSAAKSLQRCVVQRHHVDVPRQCCHSRPMACACLHRCKGLHNCLTHAISAHAWAFGTAARHCGCPAPRQQSQAPAQHWQQRGHQRKHGHYGGHQCKSMHWCRHWHRQIKSQEH